VIQTVFDRNSKGLEFWGGITGKPEDSGRPRKSASPEDLEFCDPYQCGILSSTVHSTVHTKPFPGALQHEKTISQEEMLDDFFDV
jgi:hypothetical protein